MKQEEGREDELVGAGYKSLHSLQSIRVKSRAKSGGESGEEGAKGRTRVAGGIMANMERGPIKSKARGNMNNLVVKHTWRDTYGIYVKKNCFKYSVKLSVILFERVIFLDINSR